MCQNIILENMQSPCLNNCGIIKLCGVLDYYTSDQLKSAIVKNIEIGYDYLIIDFTNVELVLLEGVGIIAGHNRKKKKPEIVIINMSEKVEELCRIMLIWDMLNVCKGIDEAVSFFISEDTNKTTPKLIKCAICNSTNWVSEYGVWNCKECKMRIFTDKNGNSIMAR